MCADDGTLVLSVEEGLEQGKDCADLRARRSAIELNGEADFRGQPVTLEPSKRATGPCCTTRPSIPAAKPPN